MRRHRPQILPVLSAERGLIRLVGSALVVALLSCAFLTISPYDSALCETEGSDPDEGILTVSDVPADSLLAESTGDSVVSPVEVVEAPERLTPFLTFAAIEEAWNDGCADSIVVFFPEEKITLQLGTNVPDEAVFSRQQAVYILKDALRYTVTESFEFLEFRYDKEGDAPPHADAEWSYRRGPEDEIKTETVHLTLRKEKGRWLISKMKILD